MEDVNPKVSIVLPVYNGEKYIKQSIESILNQSFSNWELIIIDDCSTDLTPEIIKKYIDKDKRISVYRNKVNSKLPKSLNNGFEKASGEYLTWTSDDNILKKDFLYELNSYLDKHSDIMLVYSDYELIDQDSKIIKKVLNKDEKWMPIHNTVGASFMYRKTVIEQLGVYDTSLFLVEDYEYWIRIYLEAKIAHIKLNLYQYRVHKRSLTSLYEYEVLEKTKQLREMYYNQLLNSIKDDEILAEFYASNRLYNIKKKRDNEMRLVIHYPKYILKVMKKNIKRIIYEVKYRRVKNVKNVQ